MTGTRAGLRRRAGGGTHAHALTGLLLVERTRVRVRRLHAVVRQSVLGTDQAGLFAQPRRPRRAADGVLFLPALSGATRAGAGTTGCAACSPAGQNHDAGTWPGP